MIQSTTSILLLPQSTLCLDSLSCYYAACRGCRAASSVKIGCNEMLTVKEHEMYVNPPANKSLLPQRSNGHHPRRHHPRSPPPVRHERPQRQHLCVSYLSGWGVGALRAILLLTTSWIGVSYPTQRRRSCAGSAPRVRRQRQQNGAPVAKPPWPLFP